MSPDSSPPQTVEKDSSLSSVLMIAARARAGKTQTRTRNLGKPIRSCTSMISRAGIWDLLAGLNTVLQLICSFQHPQSRTAGLLNHHNPTLFSPLRLKTPLLSHWSWNRIIIQINEDARAIAVPAGSLRLFALHSSTDRGRGQEPTGEAYGAFPRSVIPRNSASSYRAVTTGRQPTTTRHHAITSGSRATASRYELTATGRGSIPARYHAAAARRRSVAIRGQRVAGSDRSFTTGSWTDAPGYGSFTVGHEPAAARCRAAFFSPRKE